MTTIKVSPDHLQVVSKQFSNAKTDIEHMNFQLISQMSFMIANWEGITQQRFYNDFQVAKKSMENFL